MKLISRSQNNRFPLYDLDLYPMALALTLDLDTVNVYLSTENDVSMSNRSNVRAQKDRHTDTMKTSPYLDTLEVKKNHTCTP